MNSNASLLIRHLACLLLPLWLACHAQTPNWTTRIQALPQVVPDPAKIVPRETSVQGSSWGTGFVVAPGYMLTAYHVVQRRSEIRVGPVGTTDAGRARWLMAELVKTDPANDLALLKIPETLPALKLHPYATVPVGLEAFVIGYPQPRIQGASRKMTSGIVNGYRNSALNQPDNGMLQISAEVAQGNSGGPVMAADGTVIGMVQKKLNAARVAEKTQDWLTNVSYAMRSSQMVDFLRSTEAAYQTQTVNLNTTLRPYQLFELHQQSVLAVIGRSGTASQAPAPGPDLPGE